MLVVLEVGPALVASKAGCSNRLNSPPRHGGLQVGLHVAPTTRPTEVHGRLLVV